MKYVIKSSRNDHRNQFAIQLLILISNQKFNYQKLDIRQGRNWLPNTGWANSNVACGGAFYSTKIWVGNYPPATYAPVRWGRRLFRPEVLNSSVFIWFWLIVDRWDVIRISDEKKLMTTELFKESDRKSNKLSPISTWNFMCYKSHSFFISKQITFEVQNSNAGPYWLIIFCKLWLRNRKVAHPVY